MRKGIAYKFRSNHLGRAFVGELQDRNFKNSSIAFGPHHNYILVDSPNTYIGQVDDIDNYNKSFQLESQWSEAIKSLDKFKSEFKVGKWIIREEPDWGVSLIAKILEIPDNGFILRGVNHADEWEDSFHGLMNVNISELRLATHDEISEMLLRQAKKRGLVEGAKFKDFKGNIRTVKLSREDHYVSNTKLYCGETPKEEWKKGHSNPILFDGDKWVEVLAMTFFEWDVEELERGGKTYLRIAPDCLSRVSIKKEMFFEIRSHLRTFMKNKGDVNISSVIEQMDNIQ